MKRFFIILFLLLPILCFSFELKAPMKDFIVSSNFGYRQNPLGGTEQLNLHKGVDLIGPKSCYVYPAAPGIVIDHWLPPNQLPGYKGHDSFGGLIVIDHGNGVLTLYGHLSETYIHEGNYVITNKPIGRQGSTGKSTGEHLHFEIVIDPMKLLTGELTIKSGNFIKYINKELYGEFGDR